MRRQHRAQAVSIYLNRLARADPEERYRSARDRAARHAAGALRRLYDAPVRPVDVLIWVREAEAGQP
jgi:hypothetical protein